MSLELTGPVVVRDYRRSSTLDVERLVRVLRELHHHTTDQQQDPSISYIHTAEDSTETSEWEKLMIDSMHSAGQSGGVLINNQHCIAFAFWKREG